MSRVRVSDHALLRFLERVGGMDIEAVRSSLAASLERSQVAADSVGLTEHVILADGMMYLVRDAMVVTILHKTNPRAQAIIKNDGKRRG